MTTGSYETILLLFANARGVGTRLTAKCPASGTHRTSDARVCPGGEMLAAGIDSHISVRTFLSLSIAFWDRLGQRFHSYFYSWAVNFLNF